MEMELKFLNALNKINGIGPQKMKMLIGFFGTAENAWKADASELAQSGIGETLSQKIIEEREKINPDEEWALLEKENINILTAGDENYPRLLREISSPPYILYVKGQINIFNDPALAVVGSRKYTAYGKQAAENFSRELARAGLTIVSGLALGIDGFAHRAALEAGGKTIAFLASSLEDNNIGPRTNYELSRLIIESGALVSEYPAGITSNPGNFPARNRLMAGMTLGTLVIEAARESGSLITSNHAVEFNREVFAVPGSIYSPQSEGANNLIKAGAKLSASAKDILEELNLEKLKMAAEVKRTIPATPEEEKILKNLTHEPTHIDNVAKLTKLEASAISSTLAIMEMKGMVKNIGGQNYIII
jgi:DNA processing protein